MREENNTELGLLLEEVREELEQTPLLSNHPSLTTKVLDAMRRVPRPLFVPQDMQWAAYQNRALPIGCDQTISQPYIVALMTSVIYPKAEDIVLEIGTGSGYQTAVLSLLVDRVYSIELSDNLSKQAKERLGQLGFENVEIETGDGQLGWSEHAPYDAIIVTAATRHVPPALIEQLKPGGTLVIPIEEDSGQMLRMIRKTTQGEIENTAIIPVLFVPLRGEG